MREPVTRRRTRQQKLVRTGIGVVVAVGVAALAGTLMGDGEPEPEQTPPPTPQVAFVGKTRAEGEQAPKGRDVERQADAIRSMLDEWYQQAFVDPALFGDGTFPQVAAMFEPGARAAFAEDLATLTIGDALAEVARVEPRTARAHVTVYFQDGERPRFAVAEVRFRARASVVEATSPPMVIAQTATYHLTNGSDGWRVTWWEAEQTQESVEPSPTPTPSA